MEWGIATMNSPLSLQEQFGSIDVYVFDQILRGRLREGMRVLDAGCGGGRNLVYLLREGFDVWGVDQDAGAVGEVRALAAQLAPGLPAENFVQAPAEQMPLGDAQFDFIICNALLHFARDRGHFAAMLHELARVLRPGGIFFARLMSTVGIESLVRPLGEGRFALPGGQSVFLVDEPMLLEATAKPFHGRLLDPLKSTVVHGQRTMTTWVLRREA